MKPRRQSGGSALAKADGAREARGAVARLELANELLKKKQQRLERQIAALKNQASTDPLTGLCNRLRFNEACAAEIARSRRYHAPLALIMYDIDHFKRVNDTYGHRVGDHLLVELSKEVSSRVRISDILARWGGEEFMILAPHTTIEGARQLAEEVRSMIEQRDLAGQGRLTCSFGVTGLRASDTLDSLANRADAALYRAKEAGRNRVEVL
jgi:diguanylate cyclase (GGDEF)-like protein